MRRRRRWLCKCLQLGGIMTHLNVISCGQGAPSLFLIVMAGEGLFPADVVIVADTGWENDMLWSNGDRTSSTVFFNEVTRPLAQKYGIDAVMVRSLREDGSQYPPIPEFIESMAADPDRLDLSASIDIPLFGSNGGRLKQSCTSKWKIQAIRQEIRRRGADTALTALGLHRAESHRIKPSSVKWDLSAWPLVDLMQTRDGGSASMGIGRTWNRAEIDRKLTLRSVPFLVSTECDGCPHKNYSRWRDLSQETIDDLARFEARFSGNYFLTSYRRPLKDAIGLMAANYPENTLFDMCESGYCFT